MQGDPQVIAYLNRLLAEELSAADQYFIHAEMYKDWGLDKLHERISHERMDELEHARVLVARILFLGGRPDVAARVPIMVGADVPTMLESDLQVEYRVGALLKEVIAFCEGVHDYVTRDALMVLLEETENDHAHWLEQQLKLIRMTGLENYIQSRM
ncbi:MULTISPECIES: bacterioferritin [Gulbenkiania]|uniref:Bacterioferritin n=1 Tax=Gulbenkiania indica TaxID=375574 RepID=A0A0K6GUF0_9NEIS|nr:MULTISPECIES: bacterioferritin [Gulbenkiania]CUA82164.1 bacterioferritin [Gulbenkiania indica]